MYREQRADISATNLSVKWMKRSSHSAPADTDV